MTDRFLVQMLLPVFDNRGARFAGDVFETTRGELAERFGGVTAHMRAPAKGIWKAPDGEEAYDDIVILEVMAPAIDRAWWTAYRQRLEQRFRQDVIVVRASPIDLL